MWVVLGTDQGMVGSFNEEVADLAAGATRAAAPPAIAVGQRLARALEDRGFELRAVVEGPASAGGIVARTRQVLLALDRQRQARGPFDAALVHNRALGREGYEPRRQELLPIDPGWLERCASQAWPHPGLPMLGDRPERLVRDLVRQYLLTALQRGLGQSLAAEYAKRLAAMTAAEQNISERLRELDARYRRRRQSAITAEILEVSTSFRMVVGPGDDRPFS